jgi:hypothetical protein
MAKLYKALETFNIFANEEFTLHADKPISEDFFIRIYKNTGTDYQKAIDKLILAKKIELTKEKAKGAKENEKTISS